MSQNYSYFTSRNHQIDITTFGNSNLEDGNCIIFVHGFKGFKDWGFGPYLGNYFADKGYFVITFNFSLNGVSGGGKDFNDLDGFAKNTLSLEVEELKEIISAYKNGFFGKINSANKVGVIGHSRGGAISILASSQMNDIDALITWAAISKVDRFTEHQKSEWKEKGVYEVLNSRTNQMMRLNYSFLEDILENKNSFLSLEESLSNFTKPYLIIHGDQDLAVPILEADQIYDWANKSKTELYKIIGTGHTFDIKHPFEGTSKAFEKVLEQTNTFFYKHMRK